MRSRPAIIFTQGITAGFSWKRCCTQFPRMSDPVIESASDTALITGYAHAAYADALAEFGTPILLPRSGGSLLKRPIVHTGSYDAMGPYPLFSCADSNGLADDLEGMCGDLVTVALAPDPFGDYSVDLLHKCFDRVVEFKAHFIVDRDRPYGVRHHRYYERKALRNLTVDVCSPEELLPDWIRLYAHLIERHQLKGVKAFSPESFRRQFSVPGLVCVRARTPDGTCVGAHLWYVRGEVAYSHLAASSEVGYRLSASYATYAAALEYLLERVRWVDLGAGAGIGASDSGLTRFKQGWSNDTRIAYFCGRVLHEHRYIELVKAAGVEGVAYFPAYRNGELG